MTNIQIRPHEGYLDRKETNDLLAHLTGIQVSKSGNYVGVQIATALDVDVIPAGTPFFSDGEVKKPIKPSQKWVLDLLSLRHYYQFVVSGDKTYAKTHREEPVPLTTSLMKPVENPEGLEDEVGKWVYVVSVIATSLEQPGLTICFNKATQSFTKELLGLSKISAHVITKAKQNLNAPADLYPVFQIASTSYVIDNAKHYNIALLLTGLDQRTPEGSNVIGIPYDRMVEQYSTHGIAVDKGLLQSAMQESNTPAKKAIPKAKPKAKEKAKEKEPDPAIIEEPIDGDDSNTDDLIMEEFNLS